MHIVVSGSHGLVAGHLIPTLEGAGHRVTRLVRGERGTGATDQVHWDPDAGELDPAGLVGVDAAIHLAGVGIFSRWSAEHKRRLLDSRVKGTTLLAERLADLSPRPVVLLSASAVGFYGDRGDERLTEDSPQGGGFLAQLCHQWEVATAPAQAAGIRTVTLRSGIVQAGDGGALGTQLPLFKFGVGGRLGSGRQWTSWISIDDEVGAILHALETEDLSGPVNLTAPEPVTNTQYTTTLGRVLHRPTVAAVPGFAIKAVLGSEMATEMLLGGQRVAPAKLEASGYQFRHPQLETALRAVLSR